MRSSNTAFITCFPYNHITLNCLNYLDHEKTRFKQLAATFSGYYLSIYLFYFKKIVAV